MSNKPKLIVILGPTASGKSDLAAEIAHKFNGEIISADSRQVYRGMDIGTGKVPRDKGISLPTSDVLQDVRRQNINPIAVRQRYIYKSVRHHLLDVADPKRRFTVAQYKRLALKAIKDIQKRGKIPIICGGTGFYIRAITDNIAIPEVKPDFKLRARLEKKSVGELFFDLKQLDPERAATIDPKNPRRLIRALEIVLKTGKPVPPFGQKNSPSIPLSIKGDELPSLHKEGLGENFKILFLGIKKSPAELKKLIHARLQKHLRQGLIREVENLRKSGLSWKRLDSFGLEYRWIADYLKKLKTLSLRVPLERGEAIPSANSRRQLSTGLPRSLWSLAMTAEKKALHNEMISRLQKETEHYAKRQMVWFKRDKRIKWIKNKNQAIKLVKKIIK